MELSLVSVQAVLQADGLTLRLAEKTKLPPGPVHLTIQPTGTGAGPTMLEVLDRIQREQAERGQQPQTAAEIQAEIAEIRGDEAYAARWREIWSQTEVSNRAAK